MNRSLESSCILILRGKNYAYRAEATLWIPLDFEAPKEGKELETLSQVYLGDLKIHTLKKKGGE